MRQEEHEAPAAAFIRSNGITRRPTAHALPTQAAPGSADRAALKRYAGVAQSGPPAAAVGPGEPSFWASKVLAARMSSARSCGRRWELSR